VQDRHGAVPVLTRLKSRFPKVQLVWADSAYAGPQLAERFDALGSWQLVIVRKRPGQGFSVLPKRWIVERSFAWIGRCRRLAKDFENLARTARAFVLLAMIRLLLRRLARA
jgi:putative transposase